VIAQAEMGEGMRPIDLVKAAPWKSALFTTYALSLSFFEAVLMDAFVRGGGRNPLIVADTEGVHHALSELGARLVGREYELVPVHNNQGVFHPKISAFIGADNAHVLIGSGNLTFGGWGGNLEVTEHFHAGNRPTVLRDLADFFDLLLASNRISVGAPEKLLEFTEELRSAVGSRTDDGTVRLVHNEAQTIAERVREEAESLGGVERLCLVAPFYDEKGTGIAGLARDLNCDDIWGYVHPSGEVQGTRSSNWPHEAKELIRPGLLEVPFADDQRRLHAKLIEVHCKRGRLLVSGSANATRAALYGPNVEVSVLRIIPDVSSVWHISPCAPPMRNPYLEDQADEGQDLPKPNVLLAELQGTTVTGKILGRWQPASAQMTCNVAGVEFPLGEVSVAADGRFVAQGEPLAAEAWRTGRIVISLDAGDCRATGFLSVKAVSDLSKRAGPVAARILAILTKTETPEDVAAILSWFHEDPERLPRASSSGWSAAQNKQVADQMVSGLDFAAVVVSPERELNERAGDAGYAYAMRALLDAFRSASGAFNEEAEASQDEGAGGGSRNNSDVGIARRSEQMIATFDAMLSVALDPAHNGRHCETMLALATYLTERLRPDPKKVLGWLHSIQNALRNELSESLKSELAAIAILRVANDPSQSRVMMERRFLRRHGLLGSIEAANFENVSAFQNSLTQRVPVKTALLQLQSVRTSAEELEVLLSTDPSDPLPSLPALEQSNLWPRLKQLHSAPATRARLLTVQTPREACPRCYVGLSTSAYEDLRLQEVSRCTNARCGRLIAVVGDADDA